MAEAAAGGREAEFAEHGWDAEEVPDPQDPQTFLRSKLDWDEVGSGEHARLHRLYRDLIALLRSDPDMADPWLEHLTVDYDEDQRWVAMSRGRLRIVCNLGAGPVTVPMAGEVVLAWGDPTVDSASTVLEGHSFAVLRCG
jgi:maltooligosyltrehalose trehalohydrolase